MNTIKRILIAVDSGKTSIQVARDGFQLSQQLNAEVALLTVIDGTAIIDDSEMEAFNLDDFIKNDVKEKQKMLVDKLFEGRDVVTFIEQGHVHDTILQVAEKWEADLIVLGTQGRTGLSHLIMGSVAESVIRQSKKPLFVVPVLKT